MGSKGANKDFDYNLIKTLDAVISAGNAAKAAKNLELPLLPCHWRSAVYKGIIRKSCLFVVRMVCYLPRRRLKSIKISVR